MSATTLPATLHPDAISPGYVTYLGVMSALIFLASLCVILRFMSRSLTLKCWWDDWVILASLIFAYAAFICTILVATVGGAGYHVNTYSIAQLTQYFKITLAHNVFWSASISLSKISLVLFYYRIFAPDRRFRIMTYIVHALVVSWLIAAVFTLLFSFNPIHAQWTPGIPHTVINTYAFYLAIGFSNFSLDIIVFAMPQRRVWKLQMSLRQKFLTSLVFAVGMFVCITSIIRIVFFLRIDVADVTYSFTTPGIWTMAEMNTSIICTCMPTFPSLYRHIRTTSSQDGRSKASWLFRSWRTSTKDRSIGYSDLDKRNASNSSHAKVVPMYDHGIQVESRIDVESFDMDPMTILTREAVF